MIKTTIAAVVAGTFLMATPVRAEEKTGAPAGEKAEKSKKDDKGDKGDKGAKKDAKKDEKAGGW